MKQIGISTDVFARIWSLRQEGEETEDSILRRILWQISGHEEFQGRIGLEVNSPSGDVKSARPQVFSGIFDQRHGVRFPEGFEVERTYLGRPYRAVVRNGRWVVDGVRGEFTRLNELSRAIGTKTENAWVNWFFIDNEGRRRPVSELRDPEVISSRKIGDLAPSDQIGVSHTSENVSESKGGEKVRWCDDVKTALQELGGRASLQSIYKQVERIRRAGGRSVPPSIKNTVRKALEERCSDSENFRGEDWFEMAEGKGGGVWALRLN